MVFTLSLALAVFLSMQLQSFWPLITWCGVWLALAVTVSIARQSSRTATDSEQAVGEPEGAREHQLSSTEAAAEPALKQP